MNDNPIMQRVMMLSEMWKTETEQYRETGFFSWVGSSLVEFKTIKGFTIFQTSYEKTFDDTLICLQHAFTQQEPKKYAYTILNAINDSLIAWNKDERLTVFPDNGTEWFLPPIDNSENVDAENFIDSLSRLAGALDHKGLEFKLIVAIYPQHISDFKSYAAWIESLIRQNIPANLRFMLYDGTDAMMFKDISGRHPDKFRYLYPDLDISGAMDEILQNAKSDQKSEPENDAISFQQALIKLTGAIGYSEEKDITFFKNQCLSFAQKHSWLHLEALVYFYLHGYYVSANKHQKAILYIDQAIKNADEANQKGIDGTREMQFHYRIAKGNAFFMKKEFDKAKEAYKDCLALPADEASPLMLAGIYQMVGNALRYTGDKKAAWEAFLKGWQWLEQLEEEMLKTNAMAIFFANDMLETAGGDMLAAFTEKFEGWWGKNWRQQIKTGQMKPVI